MMYRLVRTFFHVTLRLFFRRIEVEGREHVPAHGPVLFVPNHINALVDPLLPMISMERRLTLTAKNVLARNPVLRWLMSAIGVVTFHRRQDVGKGSEPKRNVYSLRRCREILAKGGALCIFPEGVSHSDPHLRPFRHGAARIALDFLREDGNPGVLKIVPIGLLYTEKDRFRSGVWLRFGHPVDVAAWAEEHPNADDEMLTEHIRQCVQDLTVNYETRRESLLLSWTAEVLATTGEMPAALGNDKQMVADWFRLIGRLQEGYRTLIDGHRNEVDALSARIRRYRSELKRQGIQPSEVYLQIDFWRAAFFLVRELELQLVGAPMALFGVINHVVPYHVVKMIAQKLSTDKDHWATNVVYPSIAVFPFFYLVQILGAWLLLPVFWAALYTVALPYTGYYALLYRERSASALCRTRTFLYFLVNRASQSKLANEGREIIAQIHSLGEQLP